MWQVIDVNILIGVDIAILIGYVKWLLIVVRCMMLMNSWYS